MSRPVRELAREQRDAVDPAAHVWLSASAGTGKTHVLTARVMRLLLTPGVEPGNILCLTFTKAGAAEMANRIAGTLARWVRMKPEPLAAELKAIGAPHGPEHQARARSLFAHLLDAPGGLAIQTIHSFAQTLLSAFPIEAGLMPGFRPIDDREAEQLRHNVLAELLAREEERGDSRIADAVSALALDLGEGGAEGFLARCAAAADAMASLPEDERGLTLYSRRLAGVSAEEDIDQWLAGRCADDSADCAALHRLIAILEDWGASGGVEDARKLREWLAAAPGERAQMFSTLHQIWAKGDGEPRAPRGKLADNSEFRELADVLYRWGTELTQELSRERFARRLAGAFLAGRAYAAAYAAAKRTRGLVDFDDLIARAARLLSDPGMGEWIRFKLDRRIDHVLVDEAQDTNRQQWSIVRALTEEFLVGLGQRGARRRTLFTVGDYKQAIFGFQGTSPEIYRQTGQRLSELAVNAWRAAEDSDDGDAVALEWRELSLNRSFRSTGPVLRFVDGLIEVLGPEGFGAPLDVPEHVPTRGEIGRVELLRPHRLPESEGDPEVAGEEKWESDVTRDYAARLARMVRSWIANPEQRLADGRLIRPGDIMILLQRRGALAPLLVARLHEEGVPVAGVDRLRLGEPLAVQDVLAAARFALQPLDDLSLACLLVSPLIGWSQEELLERGHRAPGVHLWRHLRDSRPDAPGMELLRQILARVDFVTPARFFEELLVGPGDGRARLTARLGAEVLDPLNELVNAAMQFEEGGGTSLQGFVDWFERGDVDVRREQGAAGDAVRVMTVHGAKGLQAPVVLLADIASDPEQGANRGSELILEQGERLPLLPILKAERHGRIGDILRMQEERERAERRRLLYVALTRAEERLVMAGSLGKKSREASETSWFPCLQQAMEALGVEPVEDELWGARWCYDGASPPAAREPTPERAEAVALPPWLTSPAPAESRPPRPLAPTAQGDSGEPAPPPGSEALRQAAERGRLMHTLFERLPDVAAEHRLRAGAAWLAHAAPGLELGARQALLGEVCGIIGDPAHAALFGPGALAEAPVAAVVGGTVVTGRVDRLLVTPDAVLIVDFKTGSRVPRDAATAPAGHVRQMAWYAAALGRIFPGRRVEAALLYVAGPRLVTVPPELLASHAPD